MFLLLSKDLTFIFYLCINIGLPALKGYISTAKYQTTRIVTNPLEKFILLEETSQEVGKENVCIEPLEHDRGAQTPQQAHDVKMTSDIDVDAAS